MSDSTPLLRLCVVINPAFALRTCYGEQFTQLQSMGYEITALAGASEEEHNSARALGVKTHVVPMARYPHLLRDISCLFKLWMVFRRERFDVIQVSTPKASLLGIIAARLAGSRGIMYLVRGRAYECKPSMLRWIYSRLDSLCCTLADMVVPVSASLRDQLVREGICHPGKLRLVAAGSSQGVDATAYSPSLARLKAADEIRTSLQLSVHSQLVLFVGWVRREKGVIELVEAIRTLRAENVDIHLLVLGDANEPDDIDAMTWRLLRDEAGFHWHPWAGDTAPYYHASDMVVLPSWREGFPRVVLEAAAAGKPVITTDVTGCRDSIIPDTTGLLVPPRDPTALVAAMRKLYENSDLRETMGQHAALHVRQEYSRTNVWNGIEVLLRELANSNRTK